MRESLSKVHEIEKNFCVLLLSLPLRGGWIEIRYGEMINTIFGVPPLAGRVD